MVKLIIILLYLGIKINYISAQLRTNFIIKSFNLCLSQGPVKYYGNITAENKKQYFNLLMISPIPLDDKISGVWNIETLVNNRTYMQVFEIREKDFCKGMNKYGGKFWYGIEELLKFLLVFVLYVRWRLLSKYLFSVTEMLLIKNKYYATLNKIGLYAQLNHNHMYKGRYHVHHYFLDFSRMPLQTFPFGTLRFTIHGIDKAKNQMVFCLIAEVENALK